MSGRRLVLEADGGSRGNPGPAGYGAVLRDAATGEVLREVAGGVGQATNNVAEYSGLLAGLRAALELAPASLEVRMDSKLVVEQMSGRWQVKHPDMRTLARQARELVRQLPEVTFQHVPRDRNRHADRLANEAMDAAARGQQWRPRTAGSPGGASAAAPGPAASAAPAVAPGPATSPTSAVAPEAVADAAVAPEAPAQTAIGPRPPAPPAPSRAPARYGWRPDSSAPTVTVLLRHGATALTAERRFSGCGEVDLAPAGRAQAEAAARRLSREAPFAGVLTSPLRRARQTASIAAERLDIPVEVVDGLRETDFGQWEGATYAEISARWPTELSAWLASVDVAPPGGESFTTVAQRVGAVRDAILAERPGQRLLVVSHVTPIKLLVRFALDAPAGVLYRMQLDPAGLTDIDWHADGPSVLRRLNDTAHLSTD